MSQSSSADAALRDALPAYRGAGSAVAPQNWRMARRLIVLVAIPTVLGLALTGLRVTDATLRAQAYGQVARLAVLGQQVTGLAQAMEDERADTAAFLAERAPRRGLGGPAPAVCGHRQPGGLGARPGSPARPRLPGPDAGRRGHGPGQHRRSARPAQAGGAAPGFRAGGDQRLFRGDRWPVPGQRQHRRLQRQFRAHHQRPRARLAVQDDGPGLAAAGHLRRGARRGPLRTRGAHRADRRPGAAGQ